VRERVGRPTLDGMNETRSKTQQTRRARRSRAEWSSEVRRWRASGQTGAEYAQVHGLDPGTLAWWGSRLRRAQGEKRADQGGRGAAFLAVQVAPRRRPAARDEVLEVVLCNGRRVRVSGDFDAARLARLLDAAEGRSAC
jgi:hypothetical protein